MRMLTVRNDSGAGTTGVTVSALTDYDIPALAERLGAWGFAPSHAIGVLRAVYRDDLPLEERKFGRQLCDRLACELPPRSSHVVARHVSTDGTTKLLVEFRDGGATETVLMPGYRCGVAAGCVSSQIGCAMGCDFCASTRGGLSRDLTAGQIVEQFLHLRREAASVGRRVKTLVFMGMGEPMHNLDNVIAAIRRISDHRLGQLGRRNITVSTVGVVPGIDRLADEDLNVHLALSLHAPDDETRSRLVPMNRRWKVADAMTAARRFLDRTGRVPTIEYCLLAGVNDSDAQAEMLADLMTHFRAHANLIPYNAIGEGISGVTHAR